ncbi:carbon-nitrogen family hydrolase [Georgenia subflava]|uniref:Carbon-nitrogen family hydrolase n=1 Tax=Georgenia subflava TaxID=1622177 RepID=A0A6N7EBN3_9MICO|nr:carbon-nitrogen family hydrolase [Georgenia subflava]MPV35539.1 carbon-nitrogen family hydrolase [Georgenia subflava]
MRVALVQVASPPEESVEDRRARVGQLVRSAAGADLIVLPELWGVGYFAFDSYAAAAETLDGPTVAWAADLARELGAHLHLGSLVEDVGNGRYRNTAVLVAPDGTVAHDYSKIHVFGYKSKEAELLQPGTQVAVSDTPFGAVGSTTCYDLRFPELWRRLVDTGAELVVVPAAWPAARREHWRLLTTARAVEQQVYVIACNAVGTQAGTELGGHSRVVDPWGTVLAEAGTDEGVTFCDLDPALVGQVRDEFPVLKDRLSDYGALARQGGER